MKHVLLSVAALAAFSIVGKAQSLTVNNFTACAIYAAPIGGGPGCTGSIGLINGGVAIPPFSSHSFVPADYATSSPVVYAQFVNLSQVGSPGGPAVPHVVIGTSCSGFPNRDMVPVPACPGTVAVWTDLGGGNATVDVN